jgi:acetoin utilization deacetylase AcuC-like enzyme
MKVIFHDDFYRVYASEPAAARGRMEAVIECLGNKYPMIQAEMAEPEDIEEVHSSGHIEYIRNIGLYDISALAAGGAVQAAMIGMNEPAFALIRPPGHHASYSDSWGFCYFNNMAVALTRLYKDGKIKKAAMLDFDLHYGDGNVNILSKTGFTEFCNPDKSDRKSYLKEVESFLDELQVDVIGISAGFDNHREDWGGLLATEDYLVMGQMVKEAAQRLGAGYFGILEGGYNHKVLGRNVEALLEGMKK